MQFSTLFYIVLFKVPGVNMGVIDAVGITPQLHNEKDVQLVQQLDFSGVMWRWTTYGGKVDSSFDSSVKKIIRKNSSSNNSNGYKPYRFSDPEEEKIRRFFFSDLEKEYIPPSGSPYKYI
jgi:hypothetical protein